MFTNIHEDQLLEVREDPVVERPHVEQLVQVLAVAGLEVAHEEGLEGGDEGCLLLPRGHGVQVHVVQHQPRHRPQRSAARVGRHQVHGQVLRDDGPGDEENI